MGPTMGNPNGFLQQQMAQSNPRPGSFERSPERGGRNAMARASAPVPAGNSMLPFLQMMAPGALSSMQEGNFNPLIQSMIMRALSGGM